MINCREFLRNKTKEHLHTLQERGPLEKGQSRLGWQVRGHIPGCIHLADITWGKCISPNCTQETQYSLLNGCTSINSALSLIPNHFIDSKSKLINSQKNLKHNLTIIQIRKEYTPKTQTWLWQYPANCWVTSVVSDSVWPHGLQPTRLLHPWDFPGKSTGVGCHCLLHGRTLLTGKVYSPLLTRKNCHCLAFVHFHVSKTFLYLLIGHDELLEVPYRTHAF